MATVEAAVPLKLQVSFAAGLGALMGWASVRGGGIGLTPFKWLFAVYVGGHLAVFFLSIVLHSEYSLLQPFRQAGWLAGVTKVEI